MGQRERDIEIAVEAVRRAARACRAVREAAGAGGGAGGGGAIEKADGSPVTVADFASQAIVCRLLGGTGVPIVAEEGGQALRGAGGAGLGAEVAHHVSEALGERLEPSEVADAVDAGAAVAAGPRYWTLDPIDGTKGFLRGDQYAIALALIEKGEVTLGVLGCPALEMENRQGVLLVAGRGEGTRLLGIEASDSQAAAVSGRPVRVSGETALDRVRLCESVESGHSDQSRAGRIAERLGLTAEPVRIDSQCKYAMVAHGAASIYLRLPRRPGYVERIWDHAAGAICVSEAGGRVTDIEGRPLDFSRGRGLERNRGIVATSGRIHEAVLEAVAADRREAAPSAG